MQEHIFLWNVLTEEKLAKTKNKKILIFILFYLLNFWKLSLICKTRGIIMINELDENLNEEFLKFCQNDFGDCFSFDDIKAEISDIEIKNNSKTKIPKFVLQMYAYVYF